MPDTYKMTPEQEAVLNSFTCERLASDEVNKELIKNFISSKGYGLVRSLQTRGWDSDEKYTTAYYVVKNPVGEIVLFFSLKCGVMFDPNYVRRTMGLLDETDMLRKALFGAMRGDVEWKEYLDREKERLGEEEYNRRVYDIENLHYAKSTVVRQIQLDKRQTPHEGQIRVDETHPAIELVDFCVNDRTRACWGSYGMGDRTMGTTIFWWFIVPKMMEICNLAGCEYAYLFAADEPNGKLVRYYRDVLHFREATKLSAVKPYYDMTCVLMCKRLHSGQQADIGLFGVKEAEEDEKGLDYYRQVFLNEFNTPLLP